MAQRKRPSVSRMVFLVATGTPKDLALVRRALIKFFNPDCVEPAILVDIRDMKKKNPNSPLLRDLIENSWNIKPEGE